MASGRGGARSGAGRPKGAKNKLTKATKATLTELALEYAPDALETLKEIAADKDATPAARVTAANSILDRALGKPVPLVPDGDDDEAQTLAITIRAAKPVGDLSVTRSDG